MSVQPLPEGYGAVTPYLVVEGVDELLSFLAQAFDAEEKYRLRRPDGGNIWWVATHVEDVSADEQARRIEASRHKWE